MTELQTKLQELRELVETKTVECPYCQGRGALGGGYIPQMPSEHPEMCEDCQGKGRIPDPAYAPLREVLWQPCEYLGNQHWHGGGSEHGYRDNCPYYIYRSWDKMPRGALAGALKAALYPLAYVYVHTPWHSSKDIDLIALNDALDILKEETK